MQLNALDCSTCNGAFSRQSGHTNVGAAVRVNDAYWAAQRLMQLAYHAGRWLTIATRTHFDRHSLPILNGPFARQKRLPTLGILSEKYCPAHL